MIWTSREHENCLDTHQMPGKSWEQVLWQALEQGLAM